MLVISEFRVPLNWNLADGAGGQINLKGMTLTAAGNLPNGLRELIRLKRWCGKKPRMVFVELQINQALGAPHLAAAVSAAADELKRRAAAHGRAKASGARAASELKDRQVEYGLF